MKYFPLTLIITLPKKGQPEQLPKKCFCVDNSALNSLLLPVVEVHSKGQSFISLVHLSYIDKLYTMLNGSTVYSLLDCASGYHHIDLLPEVQKMSDFMTLTGKVEFKNVPHHLVKVQQIFNNQ